MMNKKTKTNVFYSYELDNEIKGTPSLKKVGDRAVWCSQLNFILLINIPLLGVMKKSFLNY